eukprot:CAMPEP_0202885942 /NCGR_PEP_ID=MMETSP1391-20130828/41923_1 /ASSEMBLY_ACC=CAM_ASM_000867 /TAXON_ID=1034604 /ORGANISM="Chlamydomonas leiostraca, Strain SAG 11-49" /LENGTH=57 /DNA_ID=CAMNT_0049569203 /DNA_START=248 /DNA_END=421 /DNA_ORIENTATION=-
MSTQRHPQWSHAPAPGRARSGPAVGQLMASLYDEAYDRGAEALEQARVLCLSLTAWF